MDKGPTLWQQARFVFGLNDLQEGQIIGRPRFAWLYASLIALAPLVIVAQAILFSGFYAQDRDWMDWMDWHLYLGGISTLVVLAILTPLGFLAKFPSGWSYSIFS